MRFYLYLLLVSVCFMSLSCEKTSSQNPPKDLEAAEKPNPAPAAQGNSDAEESSINPFYVFSEKGDRANHFTPSGFMPNGRCLTLDEGWSENCQSGKTCIKVVYDISCSKQDAKWAGIYWLNPPNNWGKRKGGFNLVGAKKLTFWAKGEKGGEQINEFIVGGITGDYPDSDKAVIGPVILTQEWQEYTIDLRGNDLTYISGGFAWSTSADVNLEQCTFYLDNIKFE